MSWQEVADHGLAALVIIAVAWAIAWAYRGTYGNDGDEE